MGTEPRKPATDVMKDASEIVHYDALGIPLYISVDHLEDYPDKRALCHWHEDVEFIHILKGTMNYQVNGKKILLCEQDCLLVNSKQMHYGYSFHKQDCTFACILFHPSLFTGNQPLLQKYIASLLENRDLEYLLVNAEHALHQEFSKTLTQIAELKQDAPFGYELEIIGLMHLLWTRLLQQSRLLPEETDEKAYSDLAVQRNMVSYICQHYTERLSLADIAASGNVSRSKCCSIFKYYLQQSPVDFLNHYRLEVSCNLLKHSDLTITDIAVACGFNHLSYYSKLFLRSYGCTPSQYRKTP